MSELRVDLGPGIILPIEIRKPDLSLVKRALSSQSVDLPPGAYWVTLQLPSGDSELLPEEFRRKYITLGEQSQTVSFRSTSTTRTRVPGIDLMAKRLPIDTMIGKPVDLGISLQDMIDLAKRLPIDTMLGGPLDSVNWNEIDWRELQKKILGDDIQVNVFQGNLLQGQVTRVVPPSSVTKIEHRPDEMARYGIQAHGELRYAQIIRPKAPALNIALPISDQSGCAIALIPQRDQAITYEIDLANKDADALLQFYERGDLGSMTTLTRKDAQISEKLLQEKIVDPIGACVGAYTLLFLGELDRLHDWTQNLFDWFTWLPDGVAILAEHQAQQGNHLTALNTLLQLGERGLPIFTVGFSYVLDRLRGYVRAESENIPARVLLKQLQSYAVYTDFTKPFVTFTGTDPRNPGDNRT